MAPSSVLFVGGTGKISSACVAEAVRRGFDVWVMNRNQSSLDRSARGDALDRQMFATLAWPVPRSATGASTPSWT